MEQNKRYIITTEINGVTHILHTNGKFHWNIIDGAIKTYKRSTEAIRQANKLARSRNIAVSVFYLRDGQKLSEASHFVTLSARVAPSEKTIY